MMKSKSSNIYDALPFSYLTGTVPDQKKPQMSDLSGSPNPPEVVEPEVATRDAPGEGKPRLGSKSRDQRVSLDVTDPTMDVVDPYLLSTGALTSGSKVNTKLSDPRDSIDSDARYRDSVPSSSDGDNIFFKSPSGSDSGYPSTSGKVKGAREMAAGLAGSSENLDADSKLPRLRVQDDGIYPYYKGKDGDPNMQQGSNPIWDKYYAGGPVSNDGYSPRTPTSPSMRPNVREDDFNALLRTSKSSDSEGQCCCACVSKTSAVVIAVLVTAIICVGLGFVIGWFVYPMAQMTTSTTLAGENPGSVYQEVHNWCNLETFCFYLKTIQYISI